MSKVTALYHIVFCTKEREMSLPADNLEDLYRFIWRTIQNMNCRLIRIGGIRNHFHILVDLHQSVPLALLVQNIKSHSSSWMKNDSRFFNFRGWWKEYFACTVSSRDKVVVIEYIKSQPVHHLGKEFVEEVKELYGSAGQPFTEFDMR